MAESDPSRTLQLVVGGRPLRLVAPADPDRLLTDPAVLQRNRLDDYMPYWAYLWPGAFLLAEAAARETWPAGGEVLEIGCGLGLAGLSALAAGASRMVFSDYEDEALGYVARSARLNGFDPARWTTRRLDWREPAIGQYARILGADVLYERRLVPLVVSLLDRALTPDGVALVAGPYRVATEDLDACLARHALIASAEPWQARDEKGRNLAGTLHRIRRA